MLTQVDHAAGHNLNKSSTPWDEEEEGEKEEVYLDYSTRYIHSKPTFFNLLFIPCTEWVITESDTEKYEVDDDTES